MTTLITLLSLPLFIFAMGVMFYIIIQSLFDFLDWLD